MGVPAKDAVGGLRLSLGHSNTPADVEYVVERLPLIVAQIKGTAPVML
jgi:cysteine sulfinate desulfinase/cysteine desulfurase-like protein